MYPVGEHAARAVDGAAEHGTALEDDPLGADGGPVAIVIPRRLELGALGAEGPDEQRLDRDRAPRTAVGSECLHRRPVRQAAVEVWARRF